jgi:hypothetical protein
MFFSCLFTLCSARVNASVIVLCDSPYERIGKWETFLISKRTGHWCLAGASVTKTATLSGISRVTVSEVMSAYMSHGKTIIRGEEQLAKINTDRKRSSYIEKDCFEKSELLRTEYSSLRPCFHKNCLT